MNASFNNNTRMDVKPLSNEQLIKISIYSLLFFTGLLSNTCIVIVFTVNRHLRKSINYFILNMAISDLFVPLFSISVYLTRSINQTWEWQISGKPGLWLCKTVHFFSDLSPLVSTFCLVFMSFDRFLAIVYPTKKHLRTTRIRRYYIVISWALPVLYCTKDFYAFRIMSNSCGVYWGPPPKTHVEILTVIKSFHSVTFILIPLVLISSFYGCILWKLRKQHRRHRKNILCDYQLKLRRKQRKKINILAFSIVLAFGICYSPWYFYYYIGLSYTKWTLPSGLLKKVVFPARVLSFANASINPVICILFNSQLRKILVGFLPCRFKADSLEYHYKLFGPKGCYSLKTAAGCVVPKATSTVTCINGNNNIQVSRSTTLEDQSNSGYVIQIENHI